MKIRKRIREMKIGETGYTLPWALSIVRYPIVGSLAVYVGYVRGDYPVGSKPQGTLRMRIVALDDGFHVFPPEDAEYTPEDRQSHLYDIRVTLHGTVEEAGAYADPWKGKPPLPPRKPPLPPRR